MITISTYNEIDNLPPLVDELNRLLPSASILIVDDNSPDGTSDWAEKRSASENGFFCIRRVGQRGLGSASITGLKWGLKDDFELIATMDADFSHPPASLVEMHDLIVSDPSVDVVLGSRYVPGGGIKNWPISRRAASRLANALARIWLGLPARDNTGALRIYRTTTLRRIDLDQVQSTGYAYVEELLLMLHRAGARMVEVPFVFTDRERGASKLSFGRGLAVFQELFWMRFRNYKHEPQKS